MNYYANNVRIQKNLMVFPVRIYDSNMILTVFVRFTLLILSFFIVKIFFQKLPESLRFCDRHSSSGNKGKRKTGRWEGGEDECIYTASEGCLDEERLEEDKEVIDLW